MGTRRGGRAARPVVAACFVLALATASSDVHASGGDDGGQPAPAAGPQFLRLAQMSGPVIRDGRVWGTISLVINLEVKDGAYLADV